jgi:hypothetical protein
MPDIVALVVEITLPILLGYLVWLLKEERKERKANTQGMKEILGYMIDRWYEEFMIQGYITTDQRNTFDGVYAAYAANRGNGAREAKWLEVKKLHIDDTKSGISPYLELCLKQKQKFDEGEK